ncbi:uncharacterized protein EI90DRAFT_3017573 [Cantharellus anzutake]|uniref:uncharacterized protein n=1 Tax=Cantharellus anzutake TaxID=1750568 RepID=UPI001907C04F|nr:uncharacterized protein EI90DRAFT_3017573 [Cantharellus anzutake]KAF8328724.1 hypothetical protein EI90DRAFT_3017573 [Cantharellus anzutake]
MVEHEQDQITVARPRDRENILGELLAQNVPTLVAVIVSGSLPHFKKKSSTLAPATKHLSLSVMAPWVSLPGDDVPLPLLLLDAWVAQCQISLKGAWFFPQAQDLMDQLLGVFQCRFLEGNLGDKAGWTVSVCEHGSQSALELAGYIDLFRVYTKFTIQEGHIKYVDTMKDINAQALPSQLISFLNIPPTQPNASHDATNPPLVELEDLSAWAECGIISQLSHNDAIHVFRPPKVTNELHLSMKPYNIFHI